jgi:hypothetical protein
MNLLQGGVGSQGVKCALTAYGTAEIRADVIILLQVGVSSMKVV